jgi:hypothetical protein
MKIAFAAALLLGVTAARNILTSVSGTYNMISTSLLTISGTYTADLGYSTAFSIAEDTTDAYLWTAGYALDVDALGTYAMTFNIADLFEMTCKVKAILLDLTPYAQSITFTRPDAILYDSTATYKLAVSATRDVAFGYVKLIHKPDVAITSVSLETALENLLGGTFTLSDWLPTTSAQWALQADDDVYFADSYLTYNIAEDFFGFSTSNWWYGSQSWYSFELSL